MKLIPGSTGEPLPKFGQNKNHQALDNRNSIVTYTQ
jgi:hypothetical protein